MEESAIIQRLDHMQARGPKGAQVAKLKLKIRGPGPGEQWHSLQFQENPSFQPGMARRPSSLLPRAIMQTSPSSPIPRIQPPGGRHGPWLFTALLLLEDVLQ